MALGLGIDTGGTYTDSVIYDFSSGEILCSSKALTTHDHLETGILDGLSLLDERYFEKIELVALSTTLATNACVENKGARAKLMFFGVDKKVFDMVGADYGLTEKDDVYLCTNSSDFNGIEAAEPDWDKLFDKLSDWFKDAQGLGVVEVFAMNSGAKLEKKAKEQASARYNIPVVCGHELFYELNSIQRGSSTLLNAKLIPIIQQFIQSIKKAFAQKNINAPIAIIRSDSTKMSEQYSATRPVETILSGPASSVTGGMELSGESDCLIVDMGGTTTDISIVKNGVPKNSDSGVKIGSWKTFVHGVFIDTFALGGDSAIRVDKGKIVQQAHRMIPLCIAAVNWPYINTELSELISSDKYHSYPLYEFLLVQKDISSSDMYSKEEKELCDVLKEGPMLYEKAARAVKRDIYTLNTKRLEAEGILIRIGMTPTDIMHIKGDFEKFDKTASLLALEYMKKIILEETSADLSNEQLCDEVYDVIKLKLYENIVRVLLTDKYPDSFKNGVTDQLNTVIKSAYKESEDKTLPFVFKTDMTLVGIGGPTHIFLPDVAKKLGTKFIIPENAKIANAVGAILSNVKSIHKVEIRTGIDGNYTVFGPEGRYFETDFEKAVLYAKDIAQQAALSDAKEKGITDSFDVDIQIDTKTATAAKGREIDLGTTVIATVDGRINRRSRIQVK